jgi:hypothetical protein
MEGSLERRFRFEDIVDEDRVAVFRERKIPWGQALRDGERSSHTLLKEDVVIEKMGDQAKKDTLLKEE